MENYEGNDPHRDVTPETPQGEAPPEGGSLLARFGPQLVFLAAFIALCVLFYQKGWVTDLHGVGSTLLTAVGLGFVIFIHELGHFAVAKWCGVYVRTFSIGLGPAIPGCSYQYGETNYQIGVFPLGGYVSMMGEGEGAESEEDDTDPRSFKNKTVGQRMAIISAGVVMNVILGFACFVFVYMTRGAERRPAVLDEIDAGSPAAVHSFRTGAVISQIDDIKHDPDFPYVWFDRDLLPTVMLSKEGQEIFLVMYEPDQPEKDYRVEPRRTSEDQKPVLGISPPGSNELLPIEAKRHREGPVLNNSAGARAEPAFDFGDVVVGMTDPAKVAEGIASDDVKSVTELPIDPRDPTGKHRNYYELWRRIFQLVGKPVVMRVERREPGQSEKASPKLVDIKVPAAFQHSFGLRMRMGAIAGIRKGSPAAAAGLENGDIIEGVEVKQADGKTLAWVSARDPKAAEDVEQRLLNPEKLPTELKAWAASNPPDKTVTLRVVHTNPPPEDPNDKREARTRKNLPMKWDDAWRFNKEFPFQKTSPLSIPELGLAYKIETKVAGVEPDSPAAKAGFQEGDVITVINFFDSGSKRDDPPKMARDVELKQDEWAFVLPVLQRRADFKQLSFKVQRGGKEVEMKEVGAVEDPTWPTTEWGVLYVADTRLQRADNLWQALGMGVSRTTNFIMQIYGYLGGVITGRLSVKQFAGPGTIATTAYAIAGSNMYQFILFLGIISVNLAVINFLPIPILDGGHMVFLIYEKLRGKPASETVRVIASYCGLAMILGLMIFVIYLDIDRFR
ncbi:MAG: site-2 protease family protein [Gemmataceae bacterium]